MIRAYFIGTSLTTGWNGSTNTHLYSDAMRLRMGWASYVDGVGGSGYTIVPTFQTRLATLVAANPEVVVVEGGINDAPGGYVIATVTAAVNMFLGGLRAGLPSARIYVTASHRCADDIAAAIHNATLAIGGTFVDWGDVVEVPRATYPPGTRWLTGTGNVGAPTGDGNRDSYLSADTAHLTSAGYIYVGTRFADAIGQATVGRTFTAQLVTSDSMLGNLALGWAPLMGSGSGGPSPKLAVHGTQPRGS